MNKKLYFIIILLGSVIGFNSLVKETPNNPPIIIPRLERLPDAPKQQAPKSSDPQVDIEQQNRIINHTGSQCVWSSIETLARHHKIESCYDLTNKYKGTAGPGSVQSALTQRKANYKQVREGKQKGLAFLKEYVQEKRYGCGVGLNGTHMIVCVHYDEEKNVVKVIDNCGPHALEVQTLSLDKFKSSFDGWAVTLLPTN